MSISRGLDRPYLLPSFSTPHSPAASYEISHLGEAQRWSNRPTFTDPRWRRKGWDRRLRVMMLCGDWVSLWRKSSPSPTIGTPTGSPSAASRGGSGSSRPCSTSLLRPTIHSPRARREPWRCSRTRYLPPWTSSGAAARGARSSWYVDGRIPFQVAS